MISLTSQPLHAGLGFSPPGQAMTPAGGWVLYDSDRPAHMMRIWPNGDFQYTNAPHYIFGNILLDLAIFISQLHMFTTQMDHDVMERTPVGGSLQEQAMIRALFVNLMRRLASSDAVTAFTHLMDFLDAMIPTPPLLTPGTTSLRICELPHGLLVQVQVYAFTARMMSIPVLTHIESVLTPIDLPTHMIQLIHSGLFSNGDLHQIHQNPSAGVIPTLQQHMCTDPQSTQTLYALPLAFHETPQAEATATEPTSLSVAQPSPLQLVIEWIRDPSWIAALFIIYPHLHRQFPHSRGGR